MRLYGLAGLKGSGKNTAAKIIEDHFPKHQTELIGFADSLRSAARVIYGLTDFEMTDRVAKESPVERLGGLTPRYILQKLGTEVGRNIHDQTWLWAAQRRLDSLVKMLPLLEGQLGHMAIFTDVRYQNEVDFVTSRGGKVFIVDRGWPIDKNAHPSERPDLLTGITGVINNQFSESFLEESVTLALIKAGDY